MARAERSEEMRRWSLRSMVCAVLLGLAACAATQDALRQAQALGQAGRWDEAVQAYTAILAQQPRDVEARMGLARALVAAGEMHFQQGKALEATGQWEAALVEYWRALTYSSEHKSARRSADRLTRRGRAHELLD